MHEVTLRPRSTTGFSELVDPADLTRYEAAVAGARAGLGDRTLWHVNSTADGGGVAELAPLPPRLPPRRWHHDSVARRRGQPRLLPGDEADPQSTPRERGRRPAARRCRAADLRRRTRAEPRGDARPRTSGRRGRAARPPDRRTRARPRLGRRPRDLGVPRRDRHARRPGALGLVLPDPRRRHGRRHGLHTRGLRLGRPRSRARGHHPALHRSRLPEERPDGSGHAQRGARGGGLARCPARRTRRDAPRRLGRAHHPSGLDAGGGSRPDHRPARASGLAMGSAEGSARGRSTGSSTASRSTRRT